MHTTSWTISGSGGEVVRGTLHGVHAADASRSSAAPRAVALVMHGFKGWKDYGMLPALAEAIAGCGVIVHRFTFSHAGIDEDDRTFARPDLFRRDTWNRQVDDVRAVMKAIRAGQLEGGGLPLLLAGHSRGGVTAMLAAGRAAAAGDAGSIAGIITLAAPDTCVSLSPEDQQRLLEDGVLPTASARTGQTLEVGADFLRDVQRDPAAHDVPALLAQTRCPVLIVHGEADATVPVSAAQTLAAAAGDRAQLLTIPGADHVFGVRHPHAIDAPLPDAMQQVVREVVRFVDQICSK